jgi:hypothetical protein
VVPKVDRRAAIEDRADIRSVLARRDDMRCFLIATALLGLALPAQAQQAVSGTITTVRTGWNDDSFGVIITASQINPAKCTDNAQGYISSICQPGYHTYYCTKPLRGRQSVRG